MGPATYPIFKTCRIVLHDWLKDSLTAFFSISASPTYLKRPSRRRIKTKPKKKEIWEEYITRGVKNFERCYEFNLPYGRLPYLRRP